MEKTQQNAWDLKGRAGAALSALALLTGAAALLAFPGEIQQAVGASLFYCFSVLTPSLFPFMALTCFAVESRAGRLLGRCFSPLARYVFRLPGVCGLPLALGFFGGYPAGAKGVSLLLERGEITKEQAGRALLFCVCPGPAFAVTFLGGAVLQNLRAGWTLFAAVALSGVLLGFLLGLRHPVPPKEEKRAPSPPPGALIRSVTGAAKSVLLMCACIVLFSGVTALLWGSGALPAFSGLLSRALPFSAGEIGAAFSFLLEVTGGVGEASQVQASGLLYAFGLGFGGLCVHLQIFSLFREFPASKGKFLLFRTLHGAGAAGVCALLLRLFPRLTGVIPASAPIAVSPFSGTLWGGLSLFLMCAAFLLIAGKEESPSPQKWRVSFPRRR